MRFTFLAGSAVLLGCAANASAAPRLTLPVTSSDQVGLSVSGKARGRAVSAVFGMWSEDGALEIGGFRERNVDPAIARAAELVSGKPMQARGVCMAASLYRDRRGEGRGVSLTLDARRQQVSNVGAALAGSARSVGESRLTLGGRLRF